MIISSIEILGSGDITVLAEKSTLFADKLAFKLKYTSKSSCFSF